MPFILVVASEGSCRRLYVDNLVMRGYVAVGTASTNEAHNLLQHSIPELIIVCTVRSGYEDAILDLHKMHSLANVPIILVSPDPPDPDWMKTWGVAGNLQYPIDLRKLLPYLRPWLKPLTDSNRGQLNTPVGAFEIQDLAA